MSRFGRRIAPFVDAELRLAREAELAGKDADGFRHLERAHVLGHQDRHSPGPESSASQRMKLSISSTVLGAAAERSFGPPSVIRMSSSMRTPMSAYLASAASMPAFSDAVKAR